jgi:hypothetical protein
MLIRVCIYLWDNIYQTPKKISHLAPFCSYGPPSLRCQMKFVVEKSMNKRIAVMCSINYMPNTPLAEMQRLYDKDS